MKAGNNEIKDILLGETPIVKVYRGEDVIWERGGLPSGYTRVEYLESTGTQWISSSCKPSNNTYIKIKIAQTGNYGQFRTADNVNNFGIIIQTRPDAGFGNERLNIGRFVANTIYTVEVSKNGAYVNNELKALFSGQTFTINYPLRYFALSLNYSVIPGQYRIYEAEIKENEELIQHMIPCLDENSRPCLFDLVTRQPFYNQGTGEFLYA